MANRTTVYVGVLIVALAIIAGVWYFMGQPAAPAKLSLIIQVQGQGSTSPAAGTLPEDSGAVVSVTATPASGWVFSNWLLNGVNSTANPISVTVSADTALTAVFKTLPPTPMARYSLTIQKQGQGNTSPALGVTQITSGATVQISAIPASGYSFDHWVVNGANSTANPLSLTIGTDYSVTAVFELIAPPFMSRYSLTIQTQGQGTTNPPPGVTQVTNGAAVQVTATPDTGWLFDHWVINGQNATSNPYMLIVDTDYSVTAVFKLGGVPSMSRWSLTIQTQGQGTTSPAPGVTQVTDLSKVTITATPAVGWLFDHWVVNGANSTTNPLSLTMGTDYSVTAVFKLGQVPSMSRWSLTIQTQGQGTTTPTPGVTQVTDGVNVQITAVPASGWVFDHWVINGANSTTNPLNIQMNTDYSVTAVFKPNQTPSMSRWSLTIQVSGPGTTSPGPGVTMVTNLGVVTITAVPDQGHSLDHWVVNGQTVTTSTLTLTMTTDYSVTVVFK